MTEFGKQLRLIRIEKGLTQRQMSYDISYTAAYLSAIENGKRKPLPDLVDLICNTYGLPAEIKLTLLGAIEVDKNKNASKQKNLAAYKKEICALIMKSGLTESECDELYQYILSYKNKQKKGE